MKTNYYSDGDSFVIENYNHVPPFSSFFPALAGETGKPLWAFYTNRGQGIASFGINNKDGSMLEFLPANKAYQATPLLGFRTFLRFGKGKPWNEVFSLQSRSVYQAMRIRPYSLEIVERNMELGYEITVRYFGIPQESLPVLSRTVSIKNISNKTFNLDVLDGLPRIVPLGMNDYLVKHMSRTIEAFAEVRNLDARVPFFKLRVEPSDRPELEWLTEGYFSFTNYAGSRLPILVDPTVIFGEDTSFQAPLTDLPKVNQLLRHQMTSNIMPSSFALTSLVLKPNDIKTIQSYFGHAEHTETAVQYADYVLDRPEYIETKYGEMKNIHKNLMKYFGLVTSNDNLNNYAENSFMDNILRGGFPLTFGEGGPCVHVYSRKHGDMERDYNSFQVSATYYSQGNGSFRDVNQNRRHDLFLNPKIGTYNLDFFFNLIQLDGYNPLMINPVKFQIPKALLGRMNFKPSEDFNKSFSQITRTPVLAGDVYGFVRTFASDPLNINNLFREIITQSVPVNSIKHEEGFWIDHWIYNLDHLEQYLAVYPEKKTWLFFEKNDFTYFDSDHFVKPRREKYLISLSGQLRQYKSVAERREKTDLIASRLFQPNKVRIENGQGEILQTTLFVKLLCLATVKFSTLDPFGVGLEMEANKPGWCDALNGAPGLIGSSTHEMFELIRLVDLLLHQIIPLAPTKSVEIPHEIYSFIREVDSAVSGHVGKDFRGLWDRLATAREEYREKTFMGVSGKTRPFRVHEIKRIFERVHAVLEKSAAKAIDPDTKLPTSYFTYQVDSASLTDGWRNHLGRLEWKQHRLPSFLEGAVHFMKLLPLIKVKRLYKTVRTSALYDKKLGMYKLNTPLKDESTELGRIKVFAPGWLENESIFLHMHYKYLLGILKSGMTAEFFNEIKTGLIAFLDPKIYGRSIYENSSFLASSSFPDSRCHGKGYVARLSGATSEFMSMVYMLMIGGAPFVEVEGGVVFRPAPSLPAEWFTKNDSEVLPRHSLRFSLFGVPITYYNPSRRNTFGSRSVKSVGFEWILDGRFHQFEGPELPKDASLGLREGRLESLTIFLGFPKK